MRAALVCGVMAVVRAALVCTVIAAVTAGLVQAQILSSPSVGVGMEYKGYDFGDGLGASAADLLVIPVAARIPLGGRATLDAYSAWARGQVEVGSDRLTLAGPVDTQVRIGLQATPWMMVTVGAQLPTGKSAHTGEEALVASVLSTDLLGFSESSLGTGAAVTTSLAAGRQWGAWGVGMAAAYALRGSFEPDADASGLRFEPGNETRLRVGLDRNIGDNTLTLGGTLVTYAEDRADGQNLFRAGHRFRFDASYAFRAGAGVWTIYAADVARSNGDLTLRITDDFGAVVGDTTVTTASQNLLVAGLVGAIGVGSGLVFRPHVDLKIQSRTEPNGSAAGSGWMVAVGGDLPLRLRRRSEIFPKIRLLLGSIEDQSGTGVGITGLELRTTIRWSR